MLSKSCMTGQRKIDSYRLGSKFGRDTGPQEKLSTSGSGAPETRKMQNSCFVIASDYCWCGIRASKKAGTFSTEHRVRDVTGQSRVAEGASGGSPHTTRYRMAVEVGAHFSRNLASSWRLRGLFPTRLQRLTTAPKLASPDCCLGLAPLPSESLATEI
jgi:hypothetical protein